MSRLTDKDLYLQIISPLDADERKFFISELDGGEGISSLFAYRLTLMTPDNAVDFTALVGQRLTVTIQQFSGEPRFINGVVSRFIQGRTDTRGITTYFAEIRPWLWQLTLTTNSRIFQELSVIEIIETVFSDMGFTDFDNRTAGTYAPRTYCVQYGETAFDFVSRLMEAEGIFYFFEHTDSVHTLVLADDADAHAACPGLETARLRFFSPESSPADGWIDACTLEEELVPTKFAAEDFNFETPETDLLTSADGQTEGAYRLYEYPGKFADTDGGEAVTTRRIESVEWPRKRVRGQGFCRGFIAGFKFTLAEHGREDANADYVIRSMSILADEEQYTNTFEAFPADVVFRPPRTTRKPKIFGIQTAIVVGKSGEEIWPDEYGRVKVQFHWDQEGQNDENSSCWIRVAQVWAGKNWGTLFIPRMGAEVIVSFLEGDPDRPVIVGTLYNATQTVPYPLPDDKNKSTIKTISTKDGEAGNEIRFDDTKDAEELYVHAQKDNNIKVENDRTTEILNDETVTVKQNRAVTISEGNESLTVEKGNRTVMVNTGNETHEVKGTRDLTVNKAETHTNKADFTQEVTGNFTLKVGGDLTIEVSGSATIQAGSDVKVEAGTSLTNKAGTALTNEAGTALTNEAGTELSNKAGTSMTNEASISLTNKGSASQTVDGGGMLTIKGGLVKIN